MKDSNRSDHRSIAYIPHATLLLANQALFRAVTLNPEEIEEVSIQLNHENGLALTAYLLTIGNRRHDEMETLRDFRCAYVGTYCSLADAYEAKRSLFEGEKLTEKERAELDDVKIGDLTDWVNDTLRTRFDSRYHILHTRKEVYLFHKDS